MARKLEVSSRYESASLSVEYSLESVDTKCVEAGASIAGGARGFEDGIYIEYIEEDIGGDKLQDDPLFDYKMAAACGVIAGLCDSFFVGKFSLDRASEWGSNRVNEFVIWVAKQHSNFKGESLHDAIAFLEKEHPFVGDKVTADMGGGLQHHLRDFSHHFSPVGLAFSVLTQFTGKIYGTDQYGEFIAVPVDARWFDEGLIGGGLLREAVLGHCGLVLPHGIRYGRL